MKSKLLAFAIGMAMGTGAMAAPVFSLSNIPVGWDGQFQVKITGYESFSNLTAAGAIQVGSVNFGVFKITSIETGGSDSQQLWASGANGAEIYGVFGGITVTSVTANGTGFTLDSSGGAGSLFINPLGSMSSAGGFGQGTGGYSFLGCSLGALCYNGISNVGTGGSFLDVAWTPGVLDNAGDTTTTISGSANAIATPVAGDAKGYLSVTGGTYAFNFDSNGFSFLTAGNGPADFYMQNTFCVAGSSACAAAGDWQSRINDPLSGGYVPEPGTLALAGLGLLGVAAIRRRRNS